MENTRIDKGLKRKMRKEARDNPLTKTVKVWTNYDPAKREEILKALPDQILNGKTVTEVARELNIPVSTMHSWVMGDESIASSRASMISAELMLRIQEIADSGDALELARAREGFRAWSWIAERREHRIYGQRNHIEVENQPLNAVDKALLGSAQELLALFKDRMKEKVIEAQPVLIKPVDKSEE